MVIIDRGHYSWDPALWARDPKPLPGVHMNKVEKLRARLRNMRESTERIATNALHTGETLVVGSAGAYAEGRLSKDDGEWGYKSVPYLYMGGAVLFLTGLFAGDRYSADMFALGTGAVGGHLFRTMYETGLEAKQKNGTSGTKQMRSKVSMGIGAGGAGQQQSQQRQHTPARQSFGTVLDGLGRQA